MRNRGRASKSKRGKNSHNAGAFGGQVGLLATRERYYEERARREERRRREIRNAKRRAAYKAKKEAERKKKERDGHESRA